MDENPYKSPQRGKRSSSVRLAVTIFTVLVIGLNLMMAVAIVTAMMYMMFVP